jgi:hypothetical protein
LAKGAHHRIVAQLGPDLGEGPFDRFQGSARLFAKELELPLRRRRAYALDLEFGHTRGQHQRFKSQADQREQLVEVECRRCRRQFFAMYTAVIEQ